MNEAKYQEDSASIIEDEENLALQLDPTTFSEFQHEYDQYFQDFPASFPINWSFSHDLRSKFSKNNIIFHPQLFLSPVCQLYTSQQHKKVIQAYVKFGYFQLSLQLLQEDRVTCEKCQNASGSFGSVFDMKLFQKAIVVKSIELANKQKRLNTIASAIKQFCCLKIASVLGYAPQIQNYFGFDLVIFGNCIQFAMEKTELIRSFDKEGEKQLKQALYAFHLLHIIHFDIKPSNIAFSSQLKRIVFLDFGLSQTIKQTKGLKTLAGFRGSLSFCSEQMLHIFYDSHRHFIDVYYNDMVCLQNTIQIIKESLSKNKSYVLNENQSIYNDDFPKIYAIQRYMLCLAKYLLCSMRYRQFKDLIMQYLVPFIRNVFSFLEDINSNPLLDSFFIEQLQQFKNMDEYIQIQIKFANRSRLWSNQSHYNGLDTQEGTSSLFVNESISISINIDSQRQVYSNEQIMSILEFPQSFHFDQTEQYFHLYLRIIRFDTNCVVVSLQTKIKLASIFVNDILKETTNNMSGIQIFRKSYDYLMLYALSQPLTRWKKEHIYFILRQLIILDFNFSHIHHQFSQRITCFYKTTEEHMLHLIEIQKTLKLLLLKHLSEFQRSLQLLHEYFEQLYNQTFDKIVSINDATSKTIKNIMDKLTLPNLLKCDYTKMVSFYNNDLSQITNKELKISLQKYIYTNELFLRMSTGDINTSFTYLAHMNPHYSTNIFMNDKKYITFDLGLYELIILMKAISNTTELEHIAKLMKDCFCFQQIYDNFKFDLLIFLSKNNNDTNSYIHYANQIIKCPLKITHELISAEFILIWKKICTSPHLYIHQAQLISQCLDRIKIFLTDPDMFTMSTYLSLQNIINQSYIFQLSTQFKTDKQTFVEGVLDVLRQGSTVNNFYKMKYLVYSGSLYMSLRSAQKSYQSFKQLLSLGFQLKNLGLVNFSYINLFVTSRYLRRKDQCKLYLMAYCHICHQIGEFKGYFTNQDADLIYLTLSTIAQTKQAKDVYTFLTDLSSFITMYPFLGFFSFWIKSITKFKEKHPSFFQRQVLQQTCLHLSIWQNLYFICYFAISLPMYSNEVKIKVMRKISLSLRGMKPFAKHFVMNIYYQQTLHLIKYNKMKAKCIIQRESKRYQLKHLCRNVRKTIKEKLVTNNYSYEAPLAILRENCKKIKIY